jgi:hypothetical protein
MHVKEKFLGVPLYYSFVVFGLCLVGIVVGSFCDWQISAAFSNPKSLTLEYWALLFYTWLFSAAGVLFYLSLQKEKKGLGIFLLVLSIVYNGYQLGTWLAKQYLLVWPDNSGLANGIGYLTSALAACLEAFLVYFFLKKDSYKTYMLRVAIVIFVVAVFSELIGTFLKGFISWPRYRNIVAEGSALAYSPWWEFHFWTSSADAVRSCPSGHMIATTLIMVLPLFHPLWKYTFKGGEYLAFGISVAIVILVGTFRIYNGAHFLSDVSFVILITYATLWLADYFFFHQKGNEERELIQIKAAD